MLTLVSLQKYLQDLDILVFFFGGLFLAIIIISIEAFAQRTSFSSAISFFIYPIYALSEQKVIGTLFLGVWFFIFVTIFFYTEEDEFGKIEDIFSG